MLPELVAGEEMEYADIRHRKVRAREGRLQVTHARLRRHIEY